MRIKQAEWDWRPVAGRREIEKRAAVLRLLRSFFESKNVIEVETPILCSSVVGHPEIDLFQTEFRISEKLQTNARGDRDRATLYLQTSPEGPMRRLVAAGSGPIFQICKAFRNGDSGPRNNPEFTILEWYRPSFDLDAIMDEVEELISLVIGTNRAERRDYGELFQSEVGLDPFSAATEDIARVLQRAQHSPNEIELESCDRDEMLEAVMDSLIESRLGRERPTFVLNYPAGQASLARISNEDCPKAQRFELFIEGIEIANGFVELADACELLGRLEEFNDFRARRGLPLVPIDHRLVEATKTGFPLCAGVAIGVDRLVMLSTDSADIRDVLTFPTSSA